MVKIIDSNECQFIQIEICSNLIPTRTPTRTTTSAKQDAYTFFTRDGGTTYVGSLAITNY